LEGGQDGCQRNELCNTERGNHGMQRRQDAPRCAKRGFKMFIPSQCLIHMEPRPDNVNSARFDFRCTLAVTEKCGYEASVQIVAWERRRATTHPQGQPRRCKSK
jgi:hypothetical protein